MNRWMDREKIGFEQSGIQNKQHLSMNPHQVLCIIRQMQNPYFIHSPKNAVEATHQAVA